MRRIVRREASVLLSAYPSRCLVCLVKLFHTLFHPLCAYTRLVLFHTLICAHPLCLRQLCLPPSGSWMVEWGTSASTMCIAQPIVEAVQRPFSNRCSTTDIHYSRSSNFNPWQFKYLWRAMSCWWSQLNSQQRTLGPWSRKQVYSVHCTLY